MLRQIVSIATGSVLLWAVVLAGAHAQPPASSCPPQPEPPGRELLLKAQRQAQDRGFLWRLSRGGRDSYLYGTVHAGRPDWFALGPKTEASLLRTGVLALEINVTEPGVREALQQAMQGPPRDLPVALMQSLREAWAAECLPPEILGQGATEVHVAQLAVALAQRQGLFPLYGAESVLLMRSLGVQRPVVGLESVQQQLSALMARNEQEAADMVQSVLSEVGSPQAVQTLERLTEAWATGDLAVLEDYPQWCDCLNTAAERAAFIRLVDDRNPGMADAIGRLHQDVSVFAAVGALHVVGAQALPVLLRERGFTVTRVF
ncbi:MAG: TraB/GumN family protein [Burkholderiaceae bacterium]